VAGFILILVLVLMLRTVPQEKLGSNTITTIPKYPRYPHRTKPPLSSRGISSSSSSTRRITSTSSTSVKYALCELDFSGLSILDFGAFSWAAYLDPPSEAQKWVDDHVNPQFHFEANLLDIAGDSGLPYGPITYQLTDKNEKVRRSRRSSRMTLMRMERCTNRR